MITIRRLSECPLADALKAWNSGFEDYLVPIKMTQDQFIGRMAQEGLSAELSVVAYVDGEPAGIIVNGIRQGPEGPYAWNGGTAVAPSYRRQGVGKAMLEESFGIYRNEGVAFAWLEAIAKNANAVRLYESLGYETIDRLLVLERKQPAAFEDDGTTLRLLRDRPQVLAGLPLYDHGSAWQTQWQSCKEGEALLALGERGDVCGYALFRRSFDPAGKHVATTLLQCSVSNAAADRRPIIAGMLSDVFAVYDAPVIQQRAFNLSSTKSKDVIDCLHELGFESASEQVFMTRPMDRLHDKFH